MNIYISRDLYEHSELNWFWQFYDPQKQTMFNHINVLTPEGCRFMAKPRKEWVQSYFLNNRYFKYRKPEKYWQQDPEDRYYFPHRDHSPFELALDIFYHGYLRQLQRTDDRTLSNREFYRTYLDHIRYIKPEYRNKFVSKMCLNITGGFRQVAKLIHDNYQHNSKKRKIS